MKTIIKITFLFIILNSTTWMIPEKSHAQGGPVSFQIFYDQLSPYGTWINDPTYGYVWVPNVDPGFSPYGTNGYWELTDCGWTWVSDYPWGWAPFHYGRWNYDPSYGYGWIPDYEWGPAWVIWRRANGYYGWAAMAPGFSIDISFNRYNEIPGNRWLFVRDRDLIRHDINRYYIDRSYNNTIIGNSFLVKRTRVDMGRHTTYVAGPQREYVEKNIGMKINPLVVRDYNRPGGSGISNNELHMYRPTVQRDNPNGHRSAPTKVVGREAYKNRNNPQQHQQPQPQRQQPQPQHQQPQPQHQQPQPQHQQPQPQHQQPQPQHQQPQPQHQQPQPQHQQIQPQHQQAQPQHQQAQPQHQQQEQHQPPHQAD